jgi:pimeloyl-ACP methyl ester carboxylesterase
MLCLNSAIPLLQTETIIMMKMKKIALALILVLSVLFTYAQDITGEWNGSLTTQGTQLRVVFNITKSDKGYTTTMDSPDQKVKGVPVTTTTFENQLLKLEVANAQIQYTGQLKENAVIGTFKQAGKSFPMNLSRQKVEKTVVIRPQDPVKPYPYYSEDVLFDNKKDKITLAGTLTLPKKEGVFPVVVLITGSGQQNRDEEIMGHRPFLVLSDYLTKNGIAVLRYDDRGAGASKGNPATATTADFATDVESAIQYLKTRKEIDPKKIGLIGHSEGGSIAPMVAAHSTDVSFIVLLAGPGLPGDQILLAQQELIGKVSGISENNLAKSKVINTGAFDIVKEAINTESLKSELTNYFKEIRSVLPQQDKPEGVNEDLLIQAQVSQLSSPWMQYFIRYNPAVDLEKVKCPVLALNGAKDLQVPPKADLAAIKAALEKGGNKNVTVKELPNLNHLFQECVTGSPEEYYKIEQTISPVALAAVTDWITAQVK